MTLTAVTATVNDVREGVKVPYKIVVKNGNKVWADTVVRAAQEDVLFGFGSKTKAYGKITGMIYMDELDQSWVTLNGTNLHVDCGSEE